jgi:hypothetical protein
MNEGFMGTLGSGANPPVGASSVQRIRRERIGKGRDVGDDYLELSLQAWAEHTVVMLNNKNAI